MIDNDEDNNNDEMTTMRMLRMTRMRTASSSVMDDTDS